MWTGSLPAWKSTSAVLKLFQTTARLAVQISLVAHLCSSCWTPGQITVDLWYVTCLPACCQAAASATTFSAHQGVALAFQLGPRFPPKVTPATFPPFRSEPACPPLYQAAANLRRCSTSSCSPRLGRLLPRALASCTTRQKCTGIWKKVFLTLKT